MVRSTFLTRHFRAHGRLTSTVVVLLALAFLPVARAFGAAGFSGPLGVASRSVITEIVDLDGDGALDLVGVDWLRHTGSLLFGLGDGRFEPEILVDLPVYPSFVQAGDMDRDGRMDLVFSNYGGPEIAVLYSAGSRTFLPAQIVPVVSTFQHTLALADLDVDGWLDVVVTNRQSTVDVLRNAGGRAFDPVRTFAPGVVRAGHIAVADIDRDDRLDLVLGTFLTGSGVGILPGLGDGTFGPPRSEYTGNDAVRAEPVDVDGDGDLDIVATAAFYMGSERIPSLTLLRQDPEGGFDLELVASLNNPWGLAVADLNGDAIPDLASAGCYYGQAPGVEVHWGTGTGTFLSGGLVGPGICEVLAGDLNGDGRIDLLVTAPPLSGTSGTGIYFNEITPAQPCLDQDGDGYGAPGSPACSRGAAPDCDDQDPERSPGAAESCDGLDNDCDGRIDEDFDRDEDGFTTCGGDCDDRSAGSAPGVAEVCDGRDNDCDGDVDEEPDAGASCDDGYACTLDACSGGTCSSDETACIGLPQAGRLFGHPVALDGPFADDVSDVAWADVTGDGLLDLVQAGEGLAISPGQEPGLFGRTRTLDTGDRTVGVTAADFNSDGFVDIAHTDLLERRVSILLGQGDGSFLPGGDIPLDSYPGIVRARDLDGDQQPDLAVELPMSWRVQIHRNLGEGRFTAAASLSSQPTSAASSIALAEIEDFTRDELPDLLLLGVGLPESELFLNEGGLEFSIPLPVRTDSARALASGHLDGDSRLDLAAAGPDGVLGLMGDGHGGFEPRMTPWDIGSARALTLVDLDGDRRSDLVGGSGSYDAGLFRMLGNRDGTFGPVEWVGSGGYYRAIHSSDVNGDGCQDIAFTGTSGAGVLRGDGQGNLAFHPGLDIEDEARDVQVADLDGTGSNDILVLSPAAALVFLGDGQGAFQGLPPIPLDEGARDMILTRIDDDGVLDLVVRHVKPGVPEVTVHLGTGDGGFAPSAVRLSTGRPLFSMAAGDINADGVTDLVLANDEGDPNDGTLSTFLGRGDGSFLPALESDARVPANSLVLGEFTGDDMVDAFILRRRAGPPRNALLLVGQGDGRFIWQHPSIDLGDGGDHFTAADMNADGRLDLVLSDRGGVSVALGKAEGGMHPQQNYPTPRYLQSNITIQDMNGDGLKDLVTLNYGGSVVIYPGQGDGTLAPPVGSLAGGPSRGLDLPEALAAGDLNGDGRPDLIVGGRASRPLAVLINGGGEDVASRLPGQARGRQCPPGLMETGGPPGKGVPDRFRIPCRVDPPPCERPGR